MGAATDKNGYRPYIIEPQIIHFNADHLYRFAALQNQLVINEKPKPRKKRKVRSDLIIEDRHYQGLDNYYSPDEPATDNPLHESERWISLAERSVMMNSDSPIDLRQYIEFNPDFFTTQADGVYSIKSSYMKLATDKECQLLYLDSTTIPQLRSNGVFSLNFTHKDLLAIKPEIDILCLPASRMKFPHIDIVGPNFELIFDLNHNKITICMDYRIKIRESVTTFFPPEVFNKFTPLIQLISTASPTPYEISHHYEQLTNEPVNPELFYRTVAAHASRLSIKHAFEIPELETNLLPFQAKTVSWLLHRENVIYDKTTNRCRPVKLITDDLHDDLQKLQKNDGRVNKDLVDDQISEILNKLCFGWTRIQIENETFWFNSFTGNLCSESRMHTFLDQIFQGASSWKNQYLPAKGLLAEEMGLGKTVEIAALSLLNRRPLDELNDPIDERFGAYGDTKTVIKAKTTLVVAPDSILKQWVDEIMRLAPSLSVTVYQGVDKYPRLRDNAGMIAEYLRRFDIVFTTYTMISKELDYALYSARKKPTRTASKRKSMVDEAIDSKEQARDPGKEELLQKYRAMFQLTIRTEKPKVANMKSGDDNETDYEKALQDELELSIEHNEIPDIYKNQDYQSPLMLSQFWRVVLDEVQMVSSKFSRAFQSAALIPRYHAWGVSGTPIKKDFNDLHSILKFLKMEPFVGELAKNSWSKLTATSYPNGNSSFISLWSQIGIRHNKDMVHDDIQLPEQRRILMTVPFSLVEQENYNQLFEDFLAAVCLDINGDPVLEDWEPSPTILAYMRSWLVRLRQVCSNPQIGNLHLPSKKYRSRNQFHTSRIVATVQQLKTLDKVLDDMLEKATDQIIEAERSMILTFVEVGQFLEFILQPEEALVFLSIGSYEAEKVLHRFRLLLRKTSVKYHELRKQENLEPVVNEEDFDSVDENDTIQTKWKHEGSEKLLKYEEEIRGIRIKIRSWLTLLHKFYFLIASCHFQCYDEEYRAKIERLKLPLFTASSMFQEMKNADFSNEVSSFVTGLSETDLNVEPRVPLADHETNNEDLHRTLEQNYYDYAEHTRQELLKSSLKSVDKVVKLRIIDRGWNDDKGKTKEDNGEVLFPKTSRKFFRYSPIIKVDLLKEEIVGIKQTLFFDKFSRMVGQLNIQAQVINNWMTSLVEILCKPLVSHDKDPNGEEYEQSIIDQDYASCYLHALTQIMQDRSETINGNEGAVKTINVQKNQEKKNFQIEAGRVHDRDFLGQLQAERLSVKVNMRSSLQELVLDVKQLNEETEKEDTLDKDGNQMYQHMLSAMESKIRNIFENQKLSLVLLQRELNLTCNAVFNSRIDYFKQLQLISDSVKTRDYHMQQEELDADLVKGQERQFVNLFATLDIKKGKAIAKYRYLESLSGGTMEDAKSEELMCIICRSTITVGSLTHCGHKYCQECLERWLVTLKTCPLCKTVITASTVYNFTHYKPDLKANKISESHEIAKNLHSIYHPVDDVVVQDIQRIELKNFYSSKVDTIVRQVLYLRSQDPDVKIVIFSQWQDLLYILGTAFKAAEISYLGSYGTLTPEVGSGRRRNKYDSVEEFKDPSKNITCFLLNAKAQASGLTLINATHIFLCEPLVNASLELQAISRIHRIGQTKITTVWLFAIEKTVEESILLMSTNKRLNYIKAPGGDTAAKISESLERDLTKAESMALMNSGGIDTMINKGNGEGETVTNNDLWNAFFCARASEPKFRLKVAT